MCLQFSECLLINAHAIVNYSNKICQTVPNSSLFNNLICFLVTDIFLTNYVRS